MKLNEVLYIGLWDSLPFLRDPTLFVILSGIAFFPVLFLALFTGSAALPALVGAAVMSLAFLGLGVAQSVYYNKHWFRFQDILVASPVSALSYALGLSFSSLIGSTPALVLSFSILIYYVPIAPLNFLAVLAIAALMWLGLVFIGYTIGLSVKNTRKANSLPQILGFLLGFLPPVYYPLSLLPASLRPVAMLVPTTEAAQLAKYYFGLLPTSLSQTEIFLSWAYLLGFVVLMAFITARKAHWVDP
ncbi:MAG: ABC transporter permease [Nitrososphaerales archaeon]|jgi:ABC-2 type transport system permease protein